MTSPGFFYVSLSVQFVPDGNKLCAKMMFSSRSHTCAANAGICRAQLSVGFLRVAQRHDLFMSHLLLASSASSAHCAVVRAPRQDPCGPPLTPHVGRNVVVFASPLFFFFFCRFIFCKCVVRLLPADVSACCRLLQPTEAPKSPECRPPPPLIVCCFSPPHI